MTTKTGEIEMQFSAKEAAAELGTDPKTLRRFLRSHPDYKNAGSGGRYVFATADMPKLKSTFTEWNQPKSTRVTRRRDSEGDQGLPWSVAMSHDPADKARVRELSEARVDRLEQRLKAAGNHISQLRDDDFHARAVLAG